MEQYFYLSIYYQIIIELILFLGQECMIQKTKKLNVTAQKQIKQIKIGLIGDSGTGKSAFMQRYTLGEFKNSYEPTLGVQSGSKIIENQNGSTTNITIWDFSGKLDFVQIRNQFYKEVDILFLFCDLSSKNSIDSIQYWMRQAKENGATTIFIVGNKSDVKKVSQVQKISKDKGCPYLQISSKTGEGIQQLIKKAVGQIK